jgi:beta-ureidopropionase / N-carbamoyl-L-amino-acid hydrolase
LGIWRILRLRFWFGLVFRVRWWEPLPFFHAPVFIFDVPISFKMVLEEFRVDAVRLLRSLNELGKIGRREGFRGVTRLALSEEDGKARDLLVSWMEEEGLNVRVDPIGNIFGVRKGSNPNLKPVIMGSHVDTVIDAGIYDGAYGVLGALEVLRRIGEEGIETQHPIGVAAFTNEEGVRFQPDMMGSLVKCGGYPLEKAYARKDDDGVTVKDALKGIGYLGKDKVDPEAYFELHVEQGPVLHKKGIQIGVVEGVQGIAWWRVTLHGQANHAGTTPLDMRRDPMAGAAELYAGMLDYVATKGNALCTMGRMRLEPDAINVVPSLADFTVDYRSYDDATFKEGKAEVERRLGEIAARRGLTYEKEMTADAQPVHFRPEMVRLVEDSARRRGYTTHRLPSGAGHDAQFMHVICPTAMIFVPSIDGISHSPGEKSLPEDLERGANVLLDCALAKAKVKSST